MHFSVHLRFRDQMVEQDAQLKHNERTKSQTERLRDQQSPLQRPLLIMQAFKHFFDRQVQLVDVVKM